MDSKRVLSASQKRLCFLNEVLPEKSIFNIAGALKILGDISIESLTEAFQIVLKRHEVLRLSIIQIEGEFIGNILDEKNFRIEIVDCKYMDVDGVYIQSLAMKEFNLSQDHLIRMQLLVINPGEHILVTTMHHVISDEWSLDIFYNELTSCYTSCLIKIKPNLPVLSMQYFDYARLQRKDSSRESHETQYWLNYLNGAPNFLPILTDRSRPLSLTYLGHSCKTMISIEALKRIKDYCQNKRVTLFTFLISVFQLLLHRISGEDDIVIGYPSANRLIPEVEHLIGFFVNVIPLRSFITEDKTFDTFLIETRDNLIQGYSNQNVHFDELVSKLGVNREANIHPVFQTLFTLHTSYEDVGFAGLETSFIEIDDKFSKFDVSLFCLETANGLTIKANYSSDLFEEKTIGIIIQCYEYLLTQLINDDKLVCRVSLVPDCLVKNNTHIFTDNLDGKFIHNLFEEQALKTPQDTAIIFEENNYSFQSINEQSNQFANYLIKLGCESGDIIAISMNPSIQFVILIIGVLKAGATYLPMDTRSPAQRVENILTDAKAKFFIFSNDQQGSTKEFCLNISLKEHWAYILQENNQRIEQKICLDTACIIYTSGSTGLAKGVICKHSSIVNRIQWWWKTFPKRSNETCITLANVAFVDSVGEIFAPLLAGVPLVIPSFATTIEPDDLSVYLDRYEITRLNMVPTLLRALFDTYEDSITKHFNKIYHLEVSGEKFSEDLVLRTLETLPFLTLVNRYGSTEATSVIYNKLFLDEKNKIKIRSYIIDKTFVFILDKYLNPVPKGLVGNLYISGAALASGYLNNHQFTEEKFIHIGSGQTKERLYKTGDLARFINDDIEILGRNDRQIKINGFRVDLNEIETSLMAHQAIKRCVVVSKNQTNDNKLIAYMLLSEDNNAIQSGILKSIPNFAKENLPYYMVPVSFIVLENFPILSNGKLDLNKLQNYEDEVTLLKEAYVSPRNANEYKLTRIWENILKIPRVGVFDNFFEIGGNSIIAIKLIATIQKEFNLKYPVGNIYKYPTVASTASVLSSNFTNDKSDILLPITEIGTRKPIFLIHTAFGLAYSYTSLSYYLDNQPIYAVNDPGLNNPEESFGSIEKMAACYIKIIQSIQDSGPYILGGWSFGGTVALEMAQQLKKQKQEVEIVILFDSTNYPKNIIRNLTDAEQKEVLLDLGIEETSNEADMIINESERCVELLRNYVSSVYEGRVVLIKAKGDEFTIPFRANDVFQGWGEIIGRNLEIYSVSGLHHEIFDSRYVRYVADVLQDVLYEKSNQILKDPNLNLLDAYLHFSIEKKDEFLIKRFIDIGANIKSVDSYQRSAHDKLKYKQCDITKLNMLEKI